MAAYVEVTKKKTSNNCKKIAAKKHTNKTKTKKKEILFHRTLFFVNAYLQICACIEALFWWSVYASVFIPFGLHLARSIIIHFKPRHSYLTQHLCIRNEQQIRRLLPHIYQSSNTVHSCRSCIAIFGINSNN